MGDYADDWEPGGELDPEEALTRITLFALEHDKFRELWDKAVRDAADSAAAQVTGNAMAGRMSGQVMVDVTLRVPVPRDMEPGDAFYAFHLAVTGETNRRLTAMGNNFGGIG